MKKSYEAVLQLVDISDLDLEKRSEKDIRDLQVGRLGAIAAQKRFNGHGKDNYTAATRSRRRHPIDDAFTSIAEYGVPQEDQKAFLVSFFHRFDMLDETSPKEEIFGGECI